VEGSVKKVRRGRGMRGGELEEGEGWGERSRGVVGVVRRLRPLAPRAIEEGVAAQSFTCDGPSGAHFCTERIE